MEAKESFLWLAETSAMLVRSKERALNDGIY